MNAFLCCGCLTVALGACGKGQSATPSSPTPAAPAITERFAGTLPVNGQKFYSFSLAVFGTVNATLVSIGGPNVAPDVTVKLGIGSPSAAACSTTASTNVSTGATTLVTASEQPGVYCVTIADVGNLPAAADFVVTIDHP
jgi:hypothetical protein